MTFAFLTIVYVLQAFITLTLAIVFCIPKRNLSRSQKRKNLKNNGKKLPLKTCAKTLCKSQYCICTLI